MGVPVMLRRRYDAAEATLYVGDILSAEDKSRGPLADELGELESFLGVVRCGDERPLKGESLSRVRTGVTFDDCNWGLEIYRLQKSSVDG